MILFQDSAHDPIYLVMLFEAKPKIKKNNNKTVSTAIIF